MTSAVTGHAGEETLDALVVADDLSGAADSAVAFAAGGAPTRVVFSRDGPTPSTGVLALDTDSRRHTAQAAADAVGSALQAAPPARLRMKKVDSTLRGNIGAETAAALEVLGSPLAICAPAFPGAGRHTRDGVQWASGVRVGDVGACFPGLAVAKVGLEAVRSGRFREELGHAAADGARVVVVDADSDEDLVRIVHAGTSLPHEVLWVGSGGLGAALAASTGHSSSAATRGRHGRRVQGPALVVVGSATAVAAAQARAVLAAGATELPVAAGAVLDGADAGWAEHAAASLADGHDVVVRITEGERIEPGHGRAVVEALGETLAPVVRRGLPAVVVATGGETAMTLARAVGAYGLQVHAELEPGVVLSTLAGGPETPVVTKAGAFGDPGTLTRTLGILRAATPHEQERH